MKRIYFTVTNDLTYDQRMHRICSSLSDAGYYVELVGRKLKGSIPLQEKKFLQKRLPCFFTKGFAFYAEYNLRLFFYLLFKKMEAVCAIDLDTILPCLMVSKIRGIKSVYDAHEFFTELKEVRTRPRVQKFWLRIERLCVPRFSNGYTVSDGLAEEFKKRYRLNYTVIRNLPKLLPLQPENKQGKFLLYQGAVNEGRGFEWLIPAMKNIPYKLIICGDGNFMPQLKKLISENHISDKVELTGMLLPEQLRTVAKKASLGIGLAEREGLNQLYALPNKFLEYIHAGLPQIAMNFPEYKKINDLYPVAILLEGLSVTSVAETIIKTISDEALLSTMHEAALKAREIYCWQQEEKILLNFYQKILA